MIIINILGGLGNQMFQYAFAYAISQQKESVVKLDIGIFETYDLRKYELDLFNVSLPIGTNEESNVLKYKHESLFEKLLRKLRRKSIPLSENYYKEAHFNFDKKAYTRGDNSYFEGYWQSEKYFLKYRENILQEFSLKEELHPKSKNYQKKIFSTESVSLHIRRGDYVTNAHINSVHGTCSLDYYMSAVKEIENKVSNPHFFIFSDDLVWAKDNLSFIERITLIDLEREIPDHEDMLLMSHCKHNIIANSSFSWWGAWLNKNPKKIVIAPLKWFNETSKNTIELIPETWVRL